MGKAVNDIVIYKRNGKVRYRLNSYTQLCTIKSAEQKRELLGEDNVTLKVTSASPMECIIGDYIIVYGSAYTLNKAGNVTKSGERSFEQTYIFEGLQYKMLDAQFRSEDAGGHNPTASFSVVADLKLLIQMVVNNMNRVAFSLGEKWELGECHTTDFKDFTFNNQNCLNVVQNACKEFETEFEIEQLEPKHYKLHIRKQGGMFPATFDFSRQSGVYKLTRKHVNSSDIVTRLYVEGGTQNIGKKYRNGSERLRIAQNEESYVENKNAVTAFGIKEGSKQYDNIFPHRTGKVTAVVADNKLQFVDDGMFDLNEKDSEGNTKYLIASTTAKVKFTGNSSMAGYTFEIAEYNSNTHTFTINPYEDKRGLKIPDGGAYKIETGDEYVLLDIVMPVDPYITDAEAELLSEGQKDVDTISQPRVEYELEIASMSLERSYGSDGVISNVFNVGDYLPIRDRDLNVDKAIRIKGFTRDCYADPYKYKITLSDLVDVSIVERLIEDNIRQNEIIRINDLTNVAKARSNWKTTQELLNMVFDSDGYFDTKKIKPESIETMMLSVGNRAGQFVIKDLVITANVIASQKPNPNIIEIKAAGTASLTHYAIETQDRTWYLEISHSITLTNNEAFYIYACCEKAGTSFNIQLSQDKMMVDNGGKYYFLVGVVSSVYEGYREVTLTYGATRITGRTINCGRIESIDKKTWFDLDKGEIGGRIKFLSSAGSMRDVGDLEGDVNNANLALDGLSQQVETQGQTMGNFGAQLEEYDQAVKNLNDTTKVLEQGFSQQGTTLTEMQAYINGQSQTIAELSALVEELKAQADNTIEYYFGEGAPSLTTPPYTDWKDDLTRKSHIGDVYTDTASGLEYKFSGVNDGQTWTWKWTEVASSGVGAAIKAAQEAMGVANSKSHVYVTASVTTPPPATYVQGDLWVTLDSLKMQYCIKDSDKIAFKDEDWKAAGYTDDTKANEALGKIKDLADDGIITPAEKLQLSSLILQINADYAGLAAQAVSLGVPTKSADTVHNALNIFVKEILADMTSNSVVSRDVYNRKFTDYYTERAKLQELCTNSKGKIFLTQSPNFPPNPPYRNGDIWIEANGFKAKICVKERLVGSFVESDWKPAGYTDDTTANEALGRIRDMADDSVITPSEKLQLSCEKSNIDADFAATSAMATAISCDTTAYERAYNMLTAYLSSILRNMNENSQVVRDEYNEKFAGYYTERTRLVDAVTNKRIDSIELGVTNFFANSAYFKDTLGWNIRSSSYTLYQDSVMGSVIRCQNTGTDYFLMYTGFGNKGGNIMLPENKWRAGNVYTLAFWVKANKKLQFHVGVMEPSGQFAVAPYTQFYATESWQRVTYTFTAADKNRADTAVFIRDTTKVPFEFLMFTKFVLVEGNKAPEWSGCMAEYEAQMQANKETLDAIAGNYTQIEGGLILSTFLKLGAILKGSQYVESAGVRAMLKSIDEIAAYFGGTYAEALQGKAGTIIYHNGRLKAREADIEGKITATDGVFNGSLSLKSNPIPVEQQTIYLDFDSGFNFSGHSYQLIGAANAFFYHTIYLPSDLKYAGVRCVIENTASYGQSYQEGGKSYSTRIFIIRALNQMPLICNTEGSFADKIQRVEVYGRTYAALHAVVIDNKLRWVVENDASMHRSSAYPQVLSTFRGMPAPTCAVVGDYSVNMPQLWDEHNTYVRDGNRLWCTRNGVGSITFEWDKEVSTMNYYPIIMCKERGYGYCTHKDTRSFDIHTRKDNIADIDFEMMVLFLHHNI